MALDAARSLLAGLPNPFECLQHGTRWKFANDISMFLPRNSFGNALAWTQSVSGSVSIDVKVIASNFWWFVMRIHSKDRLMPCCCCTTVSWCFNSYTDTLCVIMCHANWLLLCTVCFAMIKHVRFIFLFPERSVVLKLIHAASRMSLETAYLLDSELTSFFHQCKNARRCALMLQLCAKFIWYYLYWKKSLRITVI